MCFVLGMLILFKDYICNIPRMRFLTIHSLTSSIYHTEMALMSMYACMHSLQNDALRTEHLTIKPVVLMMEGLPTLVTDEPLS